jgi:hypothetical protein
MFEKCPWGEEEVEKEVTARTPEGGLEGMIIPVEGGVEG